MNDFLASLQAVPLGSNQILKILISMVLILFAWGFNWFIGFIISKRIADLNFQYSWKKVTFYSSTLIVLAILGRIWLQGIQPIITILSIVAAALTITQKESLMNMMGSILILWRELFVVGDRIEVGHNRGDVIGFGIFYFTLLEISSLENGEQSTGKIIKVPNGLVLTLPVSNYTKRFPYIWHELPVAISQDSNWQKAKEILLAVGNQHTEAIQAEAQKAMKRIPRDELIVLGKLTPIVYLRQKIDHPVGLLLQLRFLCPPRQRRDIQQRMLEAILTQFVEHEDIYLLDMNPDPKSQ